MQQVLKKKVLNKKVKHIKQLLGLGLAGDKLLPTLFEELHQLIPSTSNTFVHTDQAFRVANIYDDCSEIGKHVYHYSNRLMPQIGRRFHPGWGDWLKVNNEISTNNGFVYHDFYESEYYHEFMRPLYKHDSLIAPIKQAGNPHGVLLVTRSEKDSCFNEYETSALRSLMPFIADSLSCQSGSNQSHYKSFCGTLLFNLKYKLVHASSEALSAVNHAGQGNSILANSKTILPSPLFSLVKNYVSLYRSGGSDAIPSCVMKSRWFDIECRASWLDAENTDREPLVSVTLFKVFPKNIFIWRRNHQWGLTNKQWMVVFLTLQGMTHEEIAQELKISYYTVIDHMKHIFRKIGVNNRSQLISTLL